MCHLTLIKFQDNDIPWEQHAIWFPKCSYLLLKKTRNYVEQIVSKLSEPETNQQVEIETSTNNTKEDDDTTNSVFVCKICYCKKDGVLFTPCGHMIACVDCAPALSKCPVCRTALECVVRVFLS